MEQTLSYLRLECLDAVKGITHLCFCRSQYVHYMGKIFYFAHINKFLEIHNISMKIGSLM